MPDAVVIDDEKFVLTQKDETRRSPSMGNPETQVAMNRHSIAELVLYGMQERVENVFRETKRTRRRLRRRLRGVVALTAAPKGVGAYPNGHDILRWLDDLKNDELHESDIQFMLQLHVTAAKRCRPEVLKEA